MESFGITIGEREVWANKIPFGLLPHDRTRHLYIIGQTGTGKSNLLGELVRQDIEAGEGIALIDPHGDLADQIFDHIPRSRIDDVIVIDTDDREHPIAINPFYRVPKDEQSLVAANLVSTMKHTWSDSWGPRLQYILGNATRTVIAAPRRLLRAALCQPCGRHAAQRAGRRGRPAPHLTASAADEIRETGSMRPNPNWLDILESMAGYHRSRWPDTPDCALVGKCDASERSMVAREKAKDAHE